MDRQKKINEICIQGKTKFKFRENAYDFAVWNSYRSHFKYGDPDCFSLLRISLLCSDCFNDRLYDHHLYHHLDGAEAGSKEGGVN